MKQAEINFCERWVGLRGSDGCVGWTAGRHPFEDIRPDSDSPGSLCGRRSPYAMVAGTHRGELALFDLTPRGADLLASYEYALAHGLPIEPDDFEVIDARFTRPMTTCPDCDGEGRVSIAKLKGERTFSDIVEGPDARPREDRTETAGILPGWDVTCPRCKGSREVVASLRNIGRPLRGLAGAVAELSAKVLGAADSVRVFAETADRSLEWRQLTRKVAAGLVGRRFELKMEDQDDDEAITRDGVRLGDHGLVMGMELGGGLAVTDGSWWVRDITPAESGWVTGEDEIWEMVRSIDDEIIDARWLGGEDLSIAGDMRVRARDVIDRSVMIRVDGGHYVWFWTSGRPDPDRPVLTAVRRRVSP